MWFYEVFSLGMHHNIVGNLSFTTTRICAERTVCVACFCGFLLFLFYCKKMKYRIPWSHKYSLCDRANLTDIVGLPQDEELRGFGDGVWLLRVGQALSKFRSTRAPPLFRAIPFWYCSSAHFWGQGSTSRLRSPFPLALPLKLALTPRTCAQALALRLHFPLALSARALLLLSPFSLSPNLSWESGLMNSGHVTKVGESRALT